MGYVFAVAFLNFAALLHRKMMEEGGKVKKGDGKDVAHKKPLAKGGSNKKSNLKVASASKNRSFKRTKTARMA